MSNTEKVADPPGPRSGQDEGVLRPGLAERLQRHRAFWTLEKTDRPLVHVWLGDNFLSDALGYRLREGVLSPENDGFEGGVDLWETSLGAYESVGDDAFRVPVPFYLMTWMEAVLGCRIEGKTGTAWPRHRTGSLEAIERGLSLSLPTNAWMNRLIQITRRAGDLARGRYPVGTPFLRGPLDVLAGLLGGQRMCCELYDNPARVVAIAERLADVWVEIARAHVAATPEFHGGFLGGVKGIWAPGACVMASVDYAIMLSPAHFRELFLPSYRKMFDRLEYAYIHTHSGAVRALADDLLEIESLRAVEVTIDPAGPELPELMPAFRKIQERKPLIVFGLSEEQFGFIRSALSPRGLFLCPSAMSPDEAKAMARRFRP